MKYRITVELRRARDLRVESLSTCYVFLLSIIRFSLNTVNLKANEIMPIARNNRNETDRSVPSAILPLDKTVPYPMRPNMPMKMNIGPIRVNENLI